MPLGRGLPLLLLFIWK
jgi:hypothetical protein